MQSILPNCVKVSKETDATVIFRIRVINLV